MRLIERLREQDPQVTPAVPWLAARLAAQGDTADEIVRREQQEQVATHITVRNVIMSMRLLSSVDWADFFESVSLVEEALREGTRVAEMDFPTRDQYRRAVEELARGSRFSEVEVARRAVRRARNAAAGSCRGPVGRIPPGGPGILPDLPGAGKLREGAGLPRSHPSLAEARLGAPRHRRVHRDDSAADRGDPLLSRGDLGARPASSPPSGSWLSSRSFPPRTWPSRSSTAT